MGKFLYLLIHSSVQFKMVIYVLGNSHNYVINSVSYNAENLNFCVHGTIQQGAEHEALEEMLHYYRFSFTDKSDHVK